MIARYTRTEMGRLWSEATRFECWLRVEVATAAVEAELGLIPADAAAAIAERGGFDIERIHALEAETGHDLIAFTTSVAERVGPAARYLHFGLTSNDVVDTAQALQIQQAAQLLDAGLGALGEVLARRAREFRATPMVGRTHGVHAEPITFGFVLANWYSESVRNRRRLRAAAADLRVGKLSGAVGTFAHLGPEVEAGVCRRLGLEPASIATQVIARDRHAAFIAALAVAGASLESIALEVRHLQRTEVREAEEYFSPTQKGSSAMPHKRNPVGAEQICGLARILRANAVAAMENIALWHERDISHSSAERIIFPDSCILLDYLLAKTTQLVARLQVDPERMRRNLDLTGGLIFSGQLLLELADAGLSRELAYRIVQRHAMESWRAGGDFRAALAADPEVTSRVPAATLARAFDLQRQLRHVDAVIERALAESVES